MKKNILWFDEVNKEDGQYVGGKGANLGEMINAGFPVPYGFVVTAQAYFHFISHNNLSQQIMYALRDLDVNNSKALESAGEHVRKLILKSPVPKDLLVEITTSYENLLSRRDRVIKKRGLASQIISHVSNAVKNPLVAVRSSATAEDLATASFAGQQESFLNISGESSLVETVRKCWASLFTDRAIYYRVQKGFDHSKVGLAAVVQLMVSSDNSGVAFSIDPITNDKKTIIIEAIYGLGEYIVLGRVNPDHYEIEKKSLKILKKDFKKQDVQLERGKKGNIETKVNPSIASLQKISDDQITALAKLVRDIEKHYFFPQDIEWAIEDGQVYIVQSRPITTAGDGSKKSEKLFNFDAATHLKVDQKKVLLKADPASPGIAVGVPKILKSPKENDKVVEGDILVAAYTSPDFVPAMKRASAIVTEMGGRTSHAAIVSRELGIPAVVGAGDATEILKKEKMISVNGSIGEVYTGSVYSQQTLDSVRKKTEKAANVKTLTKIYVNLAQPESAERVAKMNVDGIGLLRAEFIMAHIGTHPKAIIKQGKQKEFVKTMVEKLLMFVKPFAPRSIIYRATDFRTNEYRHLKGGEEYEIHEENPMIGYRGASRYIADRQVFDMELDAIAKVRSMGYKNLHLMIPFVRVPAEIIEIRKMIEEKKMFSGHSFKLWMMVEVPSSAIAVEDFIKAGIDGVSIGTNDLTMLLLGVDRDNHEIANLYDERNPVVLWALERVIKAAKKHKITSSICGQAPSDYPELCEKLVKWGITSLSVTPDVLDRTRLLVADIEAKLWQKSKK